jgi:hypothetical protein
LGKYGHKNVLRLRKTNKLKPHPNPPLRGGSGVNFNAGTNLEYSKANTKFEILDTPSPAGRVGVGYKNKNLLINK